MPDAFKFPHEKDEETIDVEIESNEVEIEVVDDTPERDRGRKPLDREVVDPTDEEIESYSENVKKRIKELTHARHDERRVKEATMREKQELEAFAQRILEENKTLRGYVDQGAQQVAASSLTVAEAEMAQARRQYKEAQESFDADAIIAAQEALTDAKLKLEAVKNFRPAPLQPRENPVQTAQPAPQKVQPDEKSLRWQAKNQWFGAEGFEDVTSYSLGLHQKLVNSGLDPRSDEYFEQIDARVKSKFPEIFGSSKSEASKRPASVVAPATRSSGARKVQLSTTEVALAKKFGMTPQQYAAQKIKLEATNG
jgi:hypothetical protein